MRGIVLNDPERNFLLFLGTAQRAVVEIYTKYLEFLGIIYLVHGQRFPPKTNISYTLIRTRTRTYVCVLKGKC